MPALRAKVDTSSLGDDDAARVEMYGAKALAAWKQTHPKYVRELEKKGTLLPTLVELSGQAETLYHQCRKQGMTVDQAMETVDHDVIYELSNSDPTTG